MPALSSYFLLFLVLSVFAAPSLAQAYRWTDAQGKVHFGDRPPANTEAEDISAKLESINRDSSESSTRQILQQHDRFEAAQQAERRQTTPPAAQQEQEAARRCREARQRLRVIKGRVAFFDEAGKEVKVSEQERAQHALELEQAIRGNCSD